MAVTLLYMLLRISLLGGICMIQRFRNLFTRRAISHRNVMTDFQRAQKEKGSNMTIKVIKHQLFPPRKKNHWTVYSTQSTSGSSRARRQKYVNGENIRKIWMLRYNTHILQYLVWTYQAIQKNVRQQINYDIPHQLHARYATKAFCSMGRDIKQHGEQLFLTLGRTYSRITERDQNTAKRATELQKEHLIFELRLNLTL